LFSLQHEFVEELKKIKERINKLERRKYLKNSIKQKVNKNSIKTK